MYRFVNDGYWRGHGGDYAVEKLCVSSELRFKEAASLKGAVHILRQPPEGGGGVQEPLVLADVICEQPLLDSGQAPPSILHSRQI